MKRVLGVCGSRWKADRKTPYENALRAAGIEPVLIRPDEDTPRDIAGLLLMGGSDVDPLRYNADRAPYTHASDEARDIREDLLIADFMERDLPVLAICRGVQMLNVWHGGTLIQHLETTERHRPKNVDPAEPVHSVEILAGTRLSVIVGEPLTMNVNSRHHQAIAKTGAGLLISARDPQDGTIEAIERPDKRFVVGVQWHPEDQASRDERQAKLFLAFAAAL